jgi:hypothetical protein
MARQINPLSVPQHRGKVTGKPRILYPREESAFQLGISVRMLDEYKATGEIHPRFIGGRALYHHSELERFAKANHASPFTSATSAQEQSMPQSAPVGRQLPIAF